MTSAKLAARRPKSAVCARLAAPAQQMLARGSWIAYSHSRSSEGWSDMRTTSISINRPKASVRGRLMTAAAFVLAAMVPQFAADARVLGEADLQRIASIRQLSVDVMTDIVALSRRTDLSQADSDCIKSTLRSLTQAADELQSYEYLITIESQLNDVGDDTSLRGILRFAVDNALKILETQRKQLGEISDQCARYPLSADRAKRATQFVDSTAAILKSIQPRL
jgi:hypothetical protein